MMLEGASISNQVGSKDCEWLLALSQIPRKSMPPHTVRILSCRHYSPDGGNLVALGG